MIEKTRSLLKHDKRSLETIAFGSGVSYSWLSKFNVGKIRNPGVKTLEKLVKFLSNGKRK